MADIHTIKFPTQLAKALVDQRKLVLKYETNRVLKAFDFFTCLKSTNTCGVISNFTKQLSSLLKLCKVSRSSFYNRLQDCHEMKLINKKGNRIELTSWQKACEMFDVVDTGLFHIINYDLDNDKQTIQYFIATIAIKEQTEIIEKQVAKKLNANPDTRKAYDTYMQLLNSETEFSPSALFNAQRRSYAEGAPAVLYEALHKVNPDTNRTVKTIQRQFGMKSHRSATYLKRNLSKRGLISVEKRDSAVCKYTQTIAPPTENQAPNALIVAFLMKTNKEAQIKKAKKDENCHVWYDKSQNSRTWYLTDSIKVTPGLLN